MTLCRIVLILVFFGLVVPALGRTWTDSTGKLQVEAEFVGAQPGKVFLRREDGRMFEFPLSGLSQADQDHVAELVRKRNASIEIDRSEAPERIVYGPARRLADLADQSIRESSGLARSGRHPGLFWTHNDSGDDPRLYLFDLEGRDLGYCELTGILMAYDWEDVASFRDAGKHFLLVGDVGNNGRAASVQMLHVIEEPDCDPREGFDEFKTPVVHTIYYGYEDDHRDCEALAVDPTDKTILFVSKERGLECYVYALAWPEEIAEKALIARKIGTLKIPLVTGMDVSPDGRRAVVVTYLHAYEFARAEGEDWATVFSRTPRRIVLPLRKQGESICYGPDGKTLYLTSEKLPTPLWEVPVAAPSPNAE